MPTTLRAGAEPASLDRPYDPVAQAFHWLVVALLAAQFSTEFALPYLLPKSAEDGIAAWHLALGPTILLLMLLRLAWRLGHTPPPPPADLPPALRLLSRATHWLFYAVLVVLPLLGWAAASAYGARAYLLGFIQLPAIVAKDKALGETLGQVHGAVALALLALIALHVSGALYHALVKHDGVLRRMLPARHREPMI